MSSTSYKVTINAPPEEVFDVIADVEGFKDFSSIIRDIRKVGDGLYRWKVELLGMTLEWESQVTVLDRPRRFEWRTESGTYNRGSYTLEPSGTGTTITYEMEYRLDQSMLNLIASPVISRITSLITREVLDKVEQRIKGAGKHKTATI